MSTTLNNRRLSSIHASLIIWLYIIGAVHGMLIPQTRQHDMSSATKTILSRREALQTILVGSITTTSIIISSSPSTANALEQCKSNSHNCIRTTWTAPSSLDTPSAAAAAIRDVLNSYPQEGQAGVDCNGWRIVKDENSNIDNAGTAVIALEYKSCVGPAALAINLGQPFIDDLKLEVVGRNENGGNGNIVVEVKSSSRMGSSDLFVNRKRLEYLGNKLKELGWDVPDPKYVYEMK